MSLPEFTGGDDSKLVGPEACTIGERGLRRGHCIFEDEVVVGAAKKISIQA